MFRRIAVSLTLTCYGLLALAGQGLHSLVCEHRSDVEARSVASVASEAHIAIQILDDDCCHHDNDSCAICQHHSLGQIFVVTSPAEIVLSMCELLSPPAPESISSPALYSPAQPRAPPAVV